MSAEPLFAGFHAGITDVDGLPIAYVSGGSGPPVLLLHGFPQTRAMWAHVAPDLAQRFTVVCADLRGYGASAKPRSAPGDGTYSFRAMAGDQVGLMRTLGFERFHLVGHDRGARTAHRLALDHPGAVATLTLMDIVPTLRVFQDTDRRLAGGYWHWFFLSQPEPFPERLIGSDPDYFFETCLLGWGGARLADFDPAMLEEYRRAWRDPAMIHGACSDYRAAAGIDLDHDQADLAVRIACPTLVVYGARGLMARLFDVPDTWRDRCADLRHAAIDAGHFLVDTRPRDVLQALDAFLPAAG